MSETLTDLKSIKAGDFVCLTDTETIEDLMERGISNATEGLQLEIERVYHLREQNGLMDWYLCPLKGGPDGYIKLYLFIKAVDEEFDIRIYWVPDDFANNRTCGELVDDGILHLFQEPESKYNFKPCDLEYTKWITLQTEKGDMTYDIKGGALTAECRETPSPSGIKQPQFARVVEYIANNPEAEDSEILIIEIGGLDENLDRIEVGGVVHYFQGGPVNDNDISLIQQ